MSLTVKALKAILGAYPDDTEILYEKFSDYQHLEANEIIFIKAVDQGGYVMRSHKTMSQDNKDREKTYLLFPGN